MLKPICAGLLTAWTGLALAAPFELDGRALDAVSAGATAGVIATAVGTAGLFASIHTSTGAQVTQSDPANTATSSSGAVSGGQAHAVAVGAGAATQTQVNAQANADGTYRLTIAVDTTIKGSMVEISAAATAQHGSYMGPL